MTLRRTTFRTRLRFFPETKITCKMAFKIWHVDKAKDYKVTQAPYSMANVRTAGLTLCPMTVPLSIHSGHRFASPINSSKLKFLSAIGPPHTLGSLTGVLTE